MRRNTSYILVGTILLWALVASSRAASDAGGIEFFESKIRPVLVENCYACHSASAPKLKAKLRLDTHQGMLQGGESGPAVVPGKLDDSLLISAIQYEEGGLQMPPKGKLSKEQIADLETWVKMGAPYPDDASTAAHSTTAPSNVSKPLVGLTLAEGRKFWSFIPPREQPVPHPATSAATASWAHNEIDQFILAKLEQNGLSPSPPADKRTLIRRATYDLIGLPPTMQEIEDFEKDTSPDAFAKVVDRLLASPHYGERWGRYWLDIARYADTKGYVFGEERRFAYSYTYRDYVIRAFNDDLPYNQFLIQQIAADRLDLKGDKKPLAALGFLTLGRRFLNNQQDIINDRIDVVCRGTMALTVECARCHDHKYDPIPTADYYSLYGVFASSIEPADLPLIAPPTTQNIDFDKELAAKQKTIDDFQAKRAVEIIADVKTPASITAYLAAVRDSRGFNEAQLQKLATDRSLSLWMLQRWRAYVVKLPAATTRPSTTQPSSDGVQFALADPNSPIHITPDEVPNLYTRPDKNHLKELQTQVQTFEATRPDSPPRAMAMEDLPQPVEPHIFKRGNPANLGPQVPRQFLAILSPDDRKPFTNGSGRLELAEDIASKDNPLTARVMVNRVWQGHFGFGLVRTPGDFGTRGDRPTHPELLDWLALRFENQDGWSLKTLHRLIMLSAAYQQASIDDNPAADQKDPENRLLWRQNMRRLDFEAMRDSLLFASGQIDLQHIGGPSVDILTEPFSTRRTIYAFVDRQNLPGTFRTFDFASPDATSSRRFITSVPQQALFMMNSPFVIQQAQKLAAQITSADPATRVEQMYRTVLGRDPAKNEVALGVKFVQNEQSQPAEPIASHASPWQYGYGEFDEASGHTKSFQAFTTFADGSWRGGKDFPDQTLGYAMLSASGGHPGRNVQHAVIRRWIAPRDCIVTIEGKLSHSNAEGDGVRARLVTSHDGLLAEWRVHQKSADTNVANVAVKTGDTIDFIVDCGEANSDSFDGFSWKVTITKLATALAQAGDDTGSGWDSASEFTGPTPPAPAQLTPWEKYAQVLLESNEFAFVD